MKRRWKLILVASLFFGVIGMLIYTSIGNAATFYMTVDELKAKQEQAIGKPIKVSGKIVGESVQFDADKILLTFELRGENGGTYRVPIKYEGVKPDTLNDGWEAIVEGELTEDGTLVASELLVKCPSKYEAMEKEGQEPPPSHPESEKTQKGGYEEWEK
ncbi:cytochrome c maturation protein CcmE [Halobacillus amylolyticus]|uniref:Cytochrome c maturation protein CcmE n=1 Tax=Halobacillus amylolyticus TaxID=2932259 RepID=A0ABY4HF63_9BACI|nr:cytochrome c maturation protein CcmE [Halobacillus amylolyticus]UOR12065.1 cytochrome c maturation protein CcmE [Halobacillus amylolyticus]